MAAALVDALRATPMPYLAPPLSPSFHDNYFGAYVAQMNFKSQVAKILEQKSDRALIDSGATIFFVQDRLLFVNYEPIDNAVFNTAEGQSRIVGKSLVNIKIRTSFMSVAYHAPGIKNHLLVTHKILEHYEVLFSSSVTPTKSCRMLKGGSFRKTEILWRTHCKDGLNFRQRSFQD